MSGKNADERGKFRLVMAEDHVAIREVVVAYLKSHPRIDVVGQASDGREAIDLCLRLKPEVLVLDIDLPEVNGVSVTRTLTARLPELRVLIFSSHNDSATVRQVLEAGARGVIEKTGSAEALVKAIERVAQGHAYFGERIAEALQRSFVEPVVTRTKDNLTGREREVLQLVAEGMSNKEISSRLNISVKTVENHRHNLMSKLSAHNAADLTREAYRLGYLRGNETPSDEGDFTDQR